MSKAVSFCEDLLELKGVKEKKEDEWLYYGVPRVSNILAQCQNNDYLIQWAANIGRRKYDYIRDRALEIGTAVHAMVDEYLTAKYIGHKEYFPDYDSIRDDYRQPARIAFENFILWEKNLENYNAKIEKIYGFEITVITPWYGGTIDAIMKINGVWYLIDFKTSKQIDPSYILQTSAYLWALDNGYLDVEAPSLGGIGIIRMDKSKYGIIDDLFLNKSNPEQMNIINAAQRCFMSYTDSYYRSVNHDYNIAQYQKFYNPINVFEV